MMIALGATGRANDVLASATATIGPSSSGLTIGRESAGSAASAEMGTNELGAIDLCRDYVEAQLEYFRTSHTGDGILAFAQKIRSTPGMRDGLFWQIGTGEDESPLGPTAAAAAVTEKQSADQRRPFSGYYLKPLLMQGPDAVGGVRDYRIDGRLLTGFALLAWPAQYGVTGVRSFLVNQLGNVYARDLGPDTERIARQTSVFNPDRNWKNIAAVYEDR